VFVVHSGQWRFLYGVDTTDAFVDLSPGDTILIPTEMFRDFENTGNTTGFLFAVLGGDDPGKVIWAPSVFELATQHGLVLL
jgi:mannose-6-phosphate isomerase-like protein (cupin superfamily)